MRENYGIELIVSHDLHDMQLLETALRAGHRTRGPLQAGDEAMAERYRAILESWQVVELNIREEFSEVGGQGCHVLNSSKSGGLNDYRLIDLDRRTCSVTAFSTGSRSILTA